MRVLKLFLISVVLLFLLVTALSMLLPSHVRVSRASDISAPPAAVLNPVSDTASWIYWYPGYDSLIRHESAPVISLQSSTSDSVAVQFIRNGTQPVHAVWKVLRHTADSSCTLQWYIDIRLRWYPWEKFTSLFLEKAYGAQMEIGLKNLKEYIEQGERSPG